MNTNGSVDAKTTSLAIKAAQKDAETQTEPEGNPNVAATEDRVNNAPVAGGSATQAQVLQAVQISQDDYDQIERTRLLYQQWINDDSDDEFILLTDSDDDM